MPPKGGGQDPSGSGASAVSGHTGVRCRPPALDGAGVGAAAATAQVDYKGGLWGSKHGFQAGLLCLLTTSSKCY